MDTAATTSTPPVEATTAAATTATTEEAVAASTVPVATQDTATAPTTVETDTPAAAETTTETATETAAEPVATTVVETLTEATTADASAATTQESDAPATAAVAAVTAMPTAAGVPGVASTTMPSGYSEVDSSKRQREDDSYDEQSKVQKGEHDQYAQHQGGQQDTGSTLKFKMLIQQEHAGLVIGKAGSNLSQIRQDVRPKIFCPPSMFSHFTVWMPHRHFARRRVLPWHNRASSIDHWHS